MSKPAPAALILVVDDDPDARALLHTTLLSAGFTPLLAVDGARALALLADVTPDLVLLDAVMPPPDGFETCRQIKRQPGLAHVPVIFMTGLSETEHVVSGLRAGGVDYLTKPIVLDELIARIHVHLGNARLAQSARWALDAAGRKLVATDGEGRVRWMTPQAAGVLERTPDWAGDFAAAAVALLAQRGPNRPTIETMVSGSPVRIGYIGEAASEAAEYFFRISEPAVGGEAAILRAALALTARESDVLLWIASGKSNRDISEILNISARTVNKHLEQIFIKLGVENRAAAAAIATRVIAVQD